MIQKKAGDAFRSEAAPTHVISTLSGEYTLPEQHARAVIDLCLRTGEAMLATGSSAADAVATVLRISNAYGITALHFDVAFTSISVSMNRGIKQDPLTIMRIIKVRTIDYSRLQDVYLLIDQIVSAETPIDVSEARMRLTEILSNPHPYKRWVVTAGKAILAGGVAMMFNVSFVLVLVAAASAIVSDFITKKLYRLAVPAFFTQMVAAAATTIIAVFMFWLRSVDIAIPGSNNPTVIVISGIIMLLSGVGLTASAKDALDGYYVTATARGMEVMMMTLGLAVGISFVLGISLRIGIPVSISDSLGSNTTFVSGVLGAGLAGAGFALTSYVRLRVVPITGIVAGIVYAVYFVVVPVLPEPGIAPAIAGIIAGVFSYLIYRWLKIPESAMNMVGIIALIPGLAVYRALYSLMNSEYGINQTMPAMVLALATGLGLAAGTTIGGFLARGTFGFDKATLKALKRGRRSKQF